MLTNKTALVTGCKPRHRSCSRKKSFAKEGAFVIIITTVLKSVPVLLRQKSQRWAAKQAVYGCNVSDYGACEKMAKDIMETYGHLDILVNNAGITRDDLLMKMSEEAFDAVIATNLKGTFNTIRHFSRYLLKQRSGTIINLSSVSGILGNAGQANYSASKAGVIGLTKSVARELSSRGITCNAVAPGFIDTEMTAQMTDKAKEAVKTQIPLGRVGKVDDIAEVVTFLASEKASYITGQVISVDGGMSI